MKEKKKMSLVIGILVSLIVILFIVVIILFMKLEDFSHDNIHIPNSSQYISKDDAIEVALKDIGASKSDIYDLDAELEKKYEKAIYEVSFDYDIYEYEYYIDASNGKIVKSFSRLNYDETSVAPNNYISKDEAIEIALKDINVSKSDIYDLDAELEKKYEKIVYEVSFNYGIYEYEYYIDALNGNIIKSFSERD